MKPAASAGQFLASARSRLLPASIPLRFFGAAVVFHLLAWLALLPGAQALPRFDGNLGWPLAALHLITLGVLVMSAIGASLQLLPVATRQPVRWQRAPALVWWLYLPGVAAVTLGMGLGLTPLLGAGAVLVLLALTLFAWLLAANLRGAQGMPAVVVHGWAALACLLGVLFSAAALVAGWLGWTLLPRATALALHLPLATFGFMGLLALGLSYILVPMFALAVTPDERQALQSASLAIAGLVLAGLAAAGLAPRPLRLLALGLGAAAIGLHLRLMVQALRSGMRRQLGPSFVLVRLAWGMLVLSLALALALVLQAPLAGLPALFSLVLVGGWLLSFVLGMLQRILPFLVSMHLAGRGRRAPTPSALTAERWLVLHARCHLLALPGLALAIGFDSPVLGLAAATVGGLGGLALAGFFVELLRRMRAPVAPTAPAD